VEAGVGAEREFQGTFPSDWGSVLERLLVDPTDVGALAWAKRALGEGSCTPGQAHAYDLAVKGVDLVEVLRHAPATVQEHVDRCGDGAIDRSPAPGEWSVRQIVGHLADNELVAGVRLRSMLTEEGPDLFGYDSDDWTRFAALEPVRQVIRRFKICRANTCAVLESLSEEGWRKHGHISYRGVESVRVQVAILAGHDQSHIRQLEATAAAMVAS
jgi:hypothetical protein